MSRLIELCVIYSRDLRLPEAVRDTLAECARTLSGGKK